MTSLNDLMEFNSVVRVHADGSVSDEPQYNAPELFDDELLSDTWSLLDGFSGQQGYSGPLMHSSEFIGGGLERWILSHPGLYVNLINTPADDSEPTEWAVAYRPLPEGSE
jgi:hypothetical protein